jgi:putative uracil-DNA glycosylase superfamily
LKPVIKALHFDKAIGKRYVDDSFLDMAKLDDFANIKELHNCLKSCQLCNLSKSRKNVVFDKKESAKILLVLKNPMLVDDEIGTPMNGNLGKELIKMLIDECEFNESDIYVTFVVKCFNKGDISRIDLLKCTPFLFDEIEKISPKIILTFGEVASRVILPSLPPVAISHGSIFRRQNSFVMPLFSLNFIAKNPSMKDVFIQDLTKIKKVIFC